MEILLLKNEIGLGNRAMVVFQKPVSLPFTLTTQFESC